MPDDLITTPTTSTPITIHTSFNIEPFDEAKNNWCRWLKRLEGAFKIFKIQGDEKLQYLLHYMGPDAYDILCDKTSPAEPDSKTYKEIIEIMKSHWSPEPLEIAENFRFRKREQAEGESIREYVAALQRLSIHCKFGSYLQTALRNQFVFGLRSSKIQARLLESSDLTFDKAIETAVSMEMTAKDSAELHHRSDSRSTTIHAVRSNFSQKKLHNTVNDSNVFNKKKLYCYRCGSVDHLANACSKRDMICKFCKKKGHIASVCLKEKKPGRIYKSG